MIEFNHHFGKPPISTGGVIAAILGMIFIVLVFCLMLTSCSSLKYRGDYCGKKRHDHLQSIYESYWYIKPVAHYRKPDKK